MTNEEKIVDEQLAISKNRIKKALKPIENLSEKEAKEIIGKYRVAVEPNFIAWMMLAHNSSKSSKAKYVLKENIRDEVNQNHPKMLRDFAKECGVNLEEDQYEKTSQPVLEIWKLFSKGNAMTNIAIAATLENTSLVFIPYLAKIGEKLKAKNFTYTNVHGEADIEHAKDLYAGLVEEMKGKESSRERVVEAMQKTTDFLEAILTP